MMTGMGDTTTNQSGRSGEYYPVGGGASENVQLPSTSFGFGAPVAAVVPPERLYDAQKNSLSNWLILGGAALAVLMLLFGGGSNEE